jgi:hypothetical protein
MEKHAIRIESQSPLVTRDWTNNRQEVVTIRSKELVMNDGIDSFVAEATDQLAERLEREPLPDGTVVNMQCSLCVRRWKNQQGQDMKATNVRILKIAAV